MVSKNNKLDSAKDALPAALNDVAKHDEIANAIKANINLSRTDTGDLRKRRAEQTRLYRGQDGPSDTDTRGDDNEKGSIPFAKGRLDQRTANFAQSIVEPDPIFSLWSLNRKTRFDLQEKVLQFATSCLNMEGIIARAGKILGKKMTAVLYVGFEHHPYGHENVLVSGDFLGPIWQVIDPDDFIVAPNLNRPLEESITHGHCYDETYYVILQKMASGEYLHCPEMKIVKGRDPESVDEGNVQATTNGEHASTVQVWDVLHRHIIDKVTGKSIWLRVKMTYTGAVLRIEEWKNPCSRYSLIQDPDDADGAFAETGMGYEVLAQQKISNAIYRQLLTNFRKANRNQKLYNGGLIPSDLSAKADDEWIPVDDPTKIQQVQFNAIINEALAVLQFTFGLGDVASNTPNTLSGGPASGEQRLATAERLKMQGFQTAVRDDVMRYGPAICKAARITMHFLAKYWQQYTAHYREELKEFVDVDMATRSVITLTGQNPIQLPETQLQDTIQLVSMAQLVGDMPKSILYRLTLLRQIVELSRLPDKDDILAVVDSLMAEATEQLEWAKVMEQMQKQTMLAQLAGPMYGQQQTEPTDQQQLGSQPELPAPTPGPG